MAPKLAARLAAVAVPALFFAAATASAQAPHALTPAEQQRVETLVHSMTLAQKLDYIGGTGFGVRAVPALGIPAFEMSDGPYGVRSNSGFPATTFAAGINLAATWDRTLASEVGAGIGRDARARGVHYMLGPGVNIYRSPRNGRNFEYFGEDPFLAGQIAAGYITGIQAQGVAATVKHYLGNNSEFLRHDSDTVVDDRTVHEIYLPAFEAAVKQGHVSAVMDSYNLIDGLHATENPHFNIDVLRHDWHFTGVLMSDWDATYNAVGAANGGLDIEMPTGKFMNAENLAPAIKAGTVSEATLDDKVRHLLQTAASYGWLDRDQRDNAISFFDARNQTIALQTAREGAVLLKNQGNLLPLNKAAIKTILVVGPNAYPGTPVGGGSAGVVPFHLISPLEGITTLLGPSVQVLYDRGLPSLAHLATETKFTTAAAGSKAGVTLETFPNLTVTGAPVLTSNPSDIVLDGASFKSLLADLDSAMAMLFSSPERKISHRFTGFYTASTAGRYIVTLEGSGEGSGNRVLVDGKPVIDNWTLLRAFQPHVTLDLAAGPHQIVVEEWQNSAVGGHLLFAIVPENEVVSPRARTLAAHADAVVIAAGFQQENESEAGDRTFDLPYGQAELIHELAAANPKTIVAVTSGGNVDSTGFLDCIPAYLETWYAGQSGGQALAEILFGQINPSGHLPATFERRAEDNPTFNTYYPAPGSKTVTYSEGLYVGYRGYQHNGTTPLFPFGYGLSYTTFAFANLHVTPTAASFDITNTGTRAGADVAQLYLTEDKPIVPRPTEELKGFDRVELAPGETRHLTIPLDARSFSFYDTQSHSWRIGSSRFTVHVGDSLLNTPLTAAVTVTPN